MTKPTKKYMRDRYKGMRLVSIAACNFIQANAGTKMKEAALDRLIELMKKYGPFPKPMGAKKGEDRFAKGRKQYRESKEIRAARKRLEKRKKDPKKASNGRVRPPASLKVKKGPAWDAWKAKAKAAKQAEMALKLGLAPKVDPGPITLEQQLGEL